VAASVLSTVLAQPTAIETLRRALSSGKVHHAYLFDGPDGVGKERAAFGLAQALVCERRAPGQSEACGACSACRRAILSEGEARPRHPDVVVLERGLYAPEQIGRRTPESQDLSIDQVRTLVLTHAAFSPHEGRAKVFIVRRAEELSVSAANALLKTLEEPGQATYFILLSAQAGVLLSTIRSRTQRVRFAPLPDPVIAKLLGERGVEASEAVAIAKLSRGSMSLATSFADPDESEARQAFARRALAALAAPDLGPSLELAEEAKKNKAGLDACILALATSLGDRAIEAGRAGQREAETDASRYRMALAAIAQLDGNASPQLVVESMLARMRGAL
jgi:DNA polymerase-3 subunit delta'